MHDEHEFKVPKVLTEWVEREQEVSFWGQTTTRTPAMVPAVLGNGGKLAYITALMTRPDYYAMLVDSSWDEDDLGERSETIIQAIEECFGNAEQERDEHEGELAPFPAWHDGGHSWGFFTDVPADIMVAAQEDLRRQMQLQKALFIGDVRLKPGMLVEHPEFGQAQVRLNDALGWHYCRRGAMHEFGPDSVGYATDFSCVTVPMASVDDGPKFDFTGLHRTISTPSAPVVEPAPQARKPRPR